MNKPATERHGVITETVRGIVERVTYHNPENGWSVLQVSPFDRPGQHETVIVHQTKVFAGATMEFRGAWTVHPKFGRQFRAAEALERKPASAAALEKYLGSGLIKGVGPKTAGKIVKHFGAQTLHVFEEDIDSLTEVPGIARKKLALIKEAWREHRAIREVMMFLQSHGISTLFAVRIYKAYGDEAIRLVTNDPYRLAQDFYGIGFFSADKVALSIGLAEDSPARLVAAVKHVLAASRELGHCYLTEGQIAVQVRELLGFAVEEHLPGLLARMQQERLLMVRHLVRDRGKAEACYYSRTLYFDEKYVAERLRGCGRLADLDPERMEAWIARFCRDHSFSLSDEQAAAVRSIAAEKFAILTGGPGCGKTTTTLVLVRLLEAMHKKVVLAAPTGRAAQRMTEVIDREAKTIHRLLEWQAGRFKRDEENPLQVDFLIVDESSMLDISLTAALLKGVPSKAQVLFIGDADQLPSVGAGNVLGDLIASEKVPCFRLTRVFRQARESLIIRYAHQINSGEIPRIESPFRKPELWKEKVDCLFLDSEEATRDQLGFIARVKRYFEAEREAAPGGPGGYDSPGQAGGLGGLAGSGPDPYEFLVHEPMAPYATELAIPPKFRHVDLERLSRAAGPVEELRTVLRKIHPWSSLRYGLAAADIIRQLYLEWIPKYFGPACEIQILSPMTRGSLGTAALNRMIQEQANPARPGVPHLQVGERIFRPGDRVIHRRNNYELGVFNGDIGTIAEIDNEEPTCVVSFSPDHRRVTYQKEDIVELDLAYAITIHKSQGSEFEAVIIPIFTQHFKMLFRNLIYTGLTRARQLAIFVGTRRALAMAVANQDTSRRQTALAGLLGEK